MLTEATRPWQADGLAQPGNLAIALKALPHGLSMLDDQGRVVFCNDRFLDLFASREAWLGASLSDLLGRSAATDGNVDGVRVVQLDHERLTTGRTAATLRHRLSDGRILQITHTPVETGGSVQLYEDVTERLAEEARIRHASEHDGLTGLANRTLFREQLEAAVEMHGGTDDAGALLTLDVDGFKEVNDTFGHSVGDRLLQGVAIRIKRCLRQTDQFARVGGDEFAIVCNRIGSVAHAVALADRINAAIQHPFRLDGHQIYAAISIGIALFGTGSTADEPANLLRHADIAMYRAKAEGKNTCRVFEERMETQLRSRKALERDLLAAMDRDQFFLQYQPQIDMTTGEICGVEALLRWNHPQRGLVPPNLFIAVAEELGLIVPLGEWVLRTACQQVSAWPGLVVAVNVSPIQLRHPGFSEMLDRVLEETGVAPDRVEVEITEGVLLKNTDRVTAILRLLVARGMKIALDDFGTGYSNLAYLQQFPWSKLKIDRSFVSGLEHDPGAAAIVRSVLALGSGLGIRVIAEGIESERQLALLREAGCDEGQGYLLGKPMDATALKTFQAEWSLTRREFF